ncbi:MAG: glycine C-acetyltransferase [Bacteroidota bacterium]
MIKSTVEALQQELQELKAAGLYKAERIITSKQGAEITTQQAPEVLNFCANNYLGLSAEDHVLEAAKSAIDTHGFGLSSVRFICGTQDIHKQLEADIAEFVGCEDAILYAAAFDANGGLFEPLLGKEDAIISDALNHASIIDGIRLCKAERHRYAHSDMQDLEEKLKATQHCRRRMIATDGVFSMDGDMAKLDEICNLADKYDAMVMVDDCHSTGFIGKTGRGTAEHFGVLDRVDIITGTFGKALGGASGGFTAAPKEVVEMLRQKSRPYLFSNTLAPAIVGASSYVLNQLKNNTAFRDKLEYNANFFRMEMTKAGFDILPGNTPIVPIMLYEAKLAQEFSAALLEAGIYVIGFFFPVVPRGQARIRVQLSAAHEQEHLDQAISTFTRIGKEMGILK